VENLEGAVVIPETSADMVNWYSGSEYCTEFSATSIGDGTETMVVRMVDALGPEGRQFMRLRVEPM